MERYRSGADLTVADSTSTPALLVSKPRVSREWDAFAVRPMRQNVTECDGFGRFWADPFGILYNDGGSITLLNCPVALKIIRMVASQFRLARPGFVRNSRSMNLSRMARTTPHD
jgi:hypothetical protein